MQFYLEELAFDMDIRKRINARKIVLSYFYQHCFFSLLSKKPIAKVKVFPQDAETPEYQDKKSDFLDADFLKAIAERKEAESHRDELIQAKMNELALYHPIEEAFDYILDHFFDQRTVEEVDLDYVLQIGNALPRYEAELIQKVDQYAQSFGYDQMDPMDQVLLLLGYVEYNVLQTPKEVLLNEMVELAKRYADDWAPKLINGLLNAILRTEEAGK